jgi:hypothetical protein
MGVILQFTYNNSFNIHKKAVKEVGILPLFHIQGNWASGLAQVVEYLSSKHVT